MTAREVRATALTALDGALKRSDPDMVKAATEALKALFELPYTQTG